jgi:hypothetical protein
MEEPSIEKPARENVADRNQSFCPGILADGFEPVEMSRERRLGLSPGVRVEARRAHLSPHLA